MENSYGIGVRNRYELFYDEDIDPMDLIKQTEKLKDKGSEKENKGKTAKAKAPTATKKGTKTEAAPKIADKTSAPGEWLLRPRHRRLGQEKVCLVGVDGGGNGRARGWMHVRSSRALLVRRAYLTLFHLDPPVHQYLNHLHHPLHTYQHHHVYTRDMASYL